MHLVISIVENDIWALSLRGNGEPEVLLSDIVQSLCHLGSINLVDLLSSIILAIM